MAINFPDSPSLNDIFTDETSGFTYQWDGEVWKSYTDATIGNVTKLDDISGSFNGSTQTFPLTVNGAAAPADLDPATILLSLGGVVQNPVQDYTINGTDITFTIAPLNGLTFFASYFEVGISKDYVSSGIVGPTGLSTGGFSWNTNGDLYISGVSTISNTGTASTALTVSGNARVTGILTVGSSSIAFDGTNNTITGTGITISNDGIVSGAITATTYAGDGVNLVGAGLGTESSINTTGIITASKFSGDATYITDVGGIIDGIVYNPGVGATSVSVGTNIEITFNKPIQAGVGTITLRTDSATGTIIESFDVGTSSSISISSAKLTIDPTSDLVGLTTYFVVVPEGTVKDLYNTGSNAVIDDYSFITEVDVTSYSLFTFGNNGQGALADNTAIDKSSPVQIPGTQWSNDLGGERYALMSIKTDGTLWAWGDNAYGQIGQNSTTIADYSSPVQIPGTQWSTVGYSYRNSYATKNDGTLWAWGTNGFGQFGINDITQYSSPIQVPGTQWESAHGTYYATYFKKTDGTLWVAGTAGGGGYLGQNAVSQQRSSPVQVPGTQWSSVKSGSYNAHCIKNDGTLWMWGRSSEGEMGLNNEFFYSSPTQIPGTQWTNAEGGLYYSMGLKSDGTLWAWGDNNYGKLGQNNTTDYSSPVQIPGTQWNKFTAGQRHAIASKSDGTLWAWGINTRGQLGQGDRTYYSSPRQIPGTQWNDVAFRPNYDTTAILKSV